MGGRFPGLAVFALPALTVLLALIVLWGFRPWPDDSEGPPPVPLGIEMAVGGGRALPAAQLAFVADGTAVPVTPEPAVQAAARAGGDAETGPVLAVTQGRVAAPASRAEPTPDAPTNPVPATPEAQPVSIPAAEPAPTPVAEPTTTATTGGGQPADPVTAGGGGFEESCEGGEYLLTIAFLDGEPVSDDSPVDIVLKRLDEDGSDELHLEGDLDDARSLVSTLSSEGNCVEIEIVPPGEEAGEEGEGGEESPGTGEEVPGTSEEAPEPAESPVPVSP